MKKKLLSAVLTGSLIFALAACGAKTENNGGSSVENQEPQSQTSQEAQPEASTAAESSSAEQASVTPAAPQNIEKSTDGTLTVSSANLLIVVKGNAVAMPYHLPDIAAAGVEVMDSAYDIELGAGDFYTMNIYLDEAEDYLIQPAYYNGTDAAVSMREAEAEEISMTTYADAPADQDVSIFGVKFGMTRSEVSELLGVPSYEDDGQLQWNIKVTDADSEGSLTVTFTGDAVDYVDLSIF